MTIKKAIEVELKRRKWSRYRLVKEIGERIPARTVYAYLANKRDMTSEKVSIVLEVLGLQIKRGRK